MAMVNMECLDRGDLYVSVTMPCIEVSVQFSFIIYKVSFTVTWFNGFFSLLYILLRSEPFSRGPQDPTNIKSKILLIVIITLILRQVGTVGGGTSLAAQQNNLQLLTSAPDVDINAALLAQVRIPYVLSVRV